MLKTHGWTRKAILEMHKVDSFFRESQRIAGIGNSTSAIHIVHAHSGLTS